MYQLGLVLLPSFNVTNVTRGWVGVKFAEKSIMQHYDGPMPTAVAKLPCSNNIEHKNCKLDILFNCDGM